MCVSCELSFQMVPTMESRWRIFCNVVCLRHMVVFTWRVMQSQLEMIFLLRCDRDVRAEGILRNGIPWRYLRLCRQSVHPYMQLFHQIGNS